VKVPGLPAPCSSSGPAATTSFSSTRPWSANVPAGTRATPVYTQCPNFCTTRRVQDNKVEVKFEIRILSYVFYIIFHLHMFYFLNFIFLHFSRKINVYCYKLNERFNSQLHVNQTCWFVKCLLGDAYILEKNLCRNFLIMCTWLKLFFCIKNMYIYINKIQHVRKSIM